jgi:hypothetical protein
MNELNEGGDSDQRVEDADGADASADAPPANDQDMPPAQISNAVLYARRLMGASRRMLQ